MEKDIVIDFDWFNHDMQALGFGVSKVNETLLYIQRDNKLMAIVNLDDWEFYITMDGFSILERSLLERLSNKLRKMVAGGYEKREAVVCF